MDALALIGIALLSGLGGYVASTPLRNSWCRPFRRTAKNARRKPP